MKVQPGSMFVGFLGILAACAGLTPAAASAAQFGVSKFVINAINASSEPYTQAGGHPYEVTSFIEFNTYENSITHQHQPVQDAKDVLVEVPPGLVGDPQATPRCARKAFLLASCPASTQVGTVTVSRHPEGSVQFERSGVYNIVPEAGHPAEFGIITRNKFVFLITVTVRTGEGYGLVVGDAGVPIAGLQSIALTLWGVPAEESHNEERGGSCSELEVEECLFGLEGGNQPDTDPQVPFLTMPTNCTGQPLATVLRADSWQNPGAFVEAETAMPAITGCDQLAFSPSIGIEPETQQADKPDGLHVGIEVPQTESPNVSATPEVRDITVSLPSGMTVSPAAADGLEACNDVQFAVSSGQPAHCPPASQVGEVEVVTPLLPNALKGQLFVGEPGCGNAVHPAPCGPGDAEDGNLFRLLLQVEGDGVTVKLPGVVSANSATGQLTTSFREDPQLPFSDVKVVTKGGPTAPIANPQTCGEARTTADLTPWSTPATPDAMPFSLFEVTGCTSPMAFNPGFSAGTTTPSAGEFSPFTMTLSRDDGQQDLSGVTVQTPPGLLGMLSKVQLCPEPQAAAGACGEQSLIGHTEVAAGAGSHPFWVGGKVFLTGPYKGGPFGLSIVTPAQAGPFNLGDVIVRASIHVNPNTSSLSVTSDPLPQIVDGVPLRVKTVNVAIDKPGFIFNPTNCSQLQIIGTTTGVLPDGSAGSTVPVSSPFAVAGCKNLQFKPSFKVSTRAKTSKVAGASLNVKVGSGGGQANIGKTRIVFPKQLPARLTTLQKACPDAVFSANPSGCPAASTIGTAIAHTPVLTNPLTGPVYLVSHGGVAFPDAVIVLQGEGITLYLDGNTNIKKGITSSTFNSVPDAPVASFEVMLPEGPHSAFAANIPAKAKGSMCGQSLKMPTVLTGQNGAQITQTTKIAVTGCPKKKAKKASSSRHGKGRAAKK